MWYLFNLNFNDFKTVILIPQAEKLAETSEDEYVMKKVLPNIDTWKDREADLHT